jgi:hypothetical protein
MRINLFIMIILLSNTAYSQATAGFEQLDYVGNRGPSPTSSILVPRLYYRSTGNWYGEARYNYEEVKTLSLYAGRTFSKEDSLSWSFTPVAGILLGGLKGSAAGLNIAVNYGKWYFSSALQSVFSWENKHDDFIYSWSELGYQATPRLYMGLVLQQTRLYDRNNKWEPGVQIGILLYKWTFPVYAFNPMSRDRHLVIGVTREWEWKDNGNKLYKR